MKKIIFFVALLCCNLKMYSQQIEKIKIPMVTDRNSTLLPYIEKLISFDSNNLCEIENGFYIVYFSSDRTFMFFKSEVSNDDILQFDAYTMVDNHIILIRNYDKRIYERTDIHKEFEYVSFKNDIILPLNKIGTTWYFRYSKDSIMLNSIKFCEESIDILKLKK